MTAMQIQAHVTRCLRFGYLFQDFLRSQLSYLHSERVSLTAKFSVKSVISPSLQSLQSDHQDTFTHTLTTED